jgi:hypothetical protein
MALLDIEGVAARSEPKAYAALWGLDPPVARRDLASPGRRLKGTSRVLLAAGHTVQDVPIP